MSNDFAIRTLFEADPEIPNERISAIMDFAKNGRTGSRPSACRLLKTEEVAKMFSVTPRTVQTWIKNDEVEVIRRGRIVRIPEDQFESEVRKRASGE